MTYLAHRRKHFRNAWPLLANVWDASDLSLNDSDPVSSWIDSVGSVEASATSTQRPVYHATGGPNDGPYVDFDGSNHWLDLTLNKTTATLFIVCRTDVVASTHALLAANGWVAYSNNGPKAALYFDGGGAGYQDCKIGCTDWCLLVFRVNNYDDAYVRKNGYQVTALTAGGSFGSLTSAIGAASSGGAEKFNGGIAFIGVADSDLGVTNVVAYETAIMAAKGISDYLTNPYALLVNEYDAATLALSNDDPVDTWPDNISQADASAAGTARPVFHIGDGNGPGDGNSEWLEFNGSDHYMSVTLAKTTATLFVICKTEEASGWHSLLAANGWILYANLNGANWGSYSIGGSAGAACSDWSVLVYTCSAANAHVYRQDGTEVGTSSNGSSFGSFGSLISHATTEKFHGGVAYMGIMDFPAADDLREALETLLIARLA